MADTPRPWAIIQALQARLATITLANGYRTDAGADVRTERSEGVPAAPYLALCSGSKVRPDDSRTKGERELMVFVEAHVPVTLTDAHERVVAIAEDVEDALDDYLQQPMALPLAFQESIYLDTPEGLPVQVAQMIFTTRYRR